MFEDIFNLPRIVKGVGEVYPVLLKDYMNFMQVAWILKYNKKHTYTEDEEISTLEAILFKDFSCSELKDINGNDAVKYKAYCIKCLIEIVCKDIVEVNFQDKCFYIGKTKEKCVNKFNYDVFRKVVMEQNLIQEEKFYKSKIVAKKMADAREVRSRKQGNIQFEDIISTIKNFSGVSYETIYKQSYYQTITDFSRIRNIKEHDLTVLFASQFGTKQVKIVDFSCDLELMKDSSKESIKRFSEVFGKM
nr:MAG TPA: hypothetical protein [Caudoviricetes sp.]